MFITFDTIKYYYSMEQLTYCIIGALSVFFYEIVKVLLSKLINRKAVLILVSFIITMGAACLVGLALR